MIKWILVANSSNARILEVDSKHHITEVKSFYHAQSRLHEGDLTKDGPGSTFQSVGHMRHATQPHISAKEHEVIKFASEISHYLNLEKSRARFSKLYLFSSPDFLGHLRKHFSDFTTSSIKVAINKDLTKLENGAVIDYLRDHHE